MMRIGAKGVVALGLGLWSLVMMAAPPADRLVLGLPPYLAATELEARFQPLTQYLTGQLGVQVRLRVAHSHAQHIEQVGRAAVDIAFVSSTAYLSLVERYGPRPLLGRLEVDGRAAFHGTIFVRSDASIRNLDQLTGQLFAFGSEYSATGYRAPRELLRRAGIDLLDLGGYRFLGSPENVALAVLSGDYAAGAARAEVFERYQARGLRAIAVTPPIPEDLFVASARLPPAQVTRLRELLLALRDSESGRAVLRAIRPEVTAIVAANAGGYAALRELLGGAEATPAGPMGAGSTP
ncbi:MAG: PhnD/SsuA/transferrin family substrate-binding protein [Lysobacteraceae bacterium]